MEDGMVRHETLESMDTASGELRGLRDSFSGFSWHPQQSPQGLSRRFVGVTSNCGFVMQ